MAVESQAWRAGKPSLHQASRPQASRPPGLHQASRPSGLPQASKPSGLHQQATSGLRPLALHPLVANCQPPGPPSLLPRRDCCQEYACGQEAQGRGSGLPKSGIHCLRGQVYEVDSDDDSAVGEEATSLSLCLPSFHAWMSMCPGSVGGGPGSS